MRITYEMIPQLIVDGRESDWLEFKAEMYSTSKHSSLIKDIMSMANSMHEGNKYIITGVNLLPDGRRDLCGIGTPSSDDATFQQLILNNIEPDIKFSYSTMNIENEYFGVFEIEDTSNRPYILKKDNDGLKAGECFMRKGSQQCRALRRDYDNFYYMQHRVIVEILDPCLSSMNIKRGGEIKVQFSNYSKLPLTLMHGELVVQDEDKQPVSRHFVYGFEDEYKGADFLLYMEPLSQRTGYLQVGFESSDCLRLGLNEDGFTTARFNFHLEFTDSGGHSYIANAQNGMIIANGDVLWKVRSKSTNPR